MPQLPGVYLFKDFENKTIYIGKANNLKLRVSSYFQKKGSLLPKTQSLVRQVNSVEIVPVQSEIEALILEANLIKKHRPFFNIDLRDDKDYLYIKVTKADYPRVSIARKALLGDASQIFGPFPDGSTVRRILKTLRKIFPYSTCTPKSKRACFYYHIGQCLGVCLGKIDSAQYKKMIRRFVDFMRGKKKKVRESLEKEMKAQAKKLNFEQASLLKSQIQAIDYITQPVTRVESYVANPNLLEDIRRGQLRELSKAIGLAKTPLRIEGYDISNFAGESPTGSMVVLTEGIPDKSQYRKFRIKTVTGINDYLCLKEVLKRRMKNDWPKPDLIVIDGGKGQLSSAIQALSEAGWAVPVISLAKREEEIFLPLHPKPLNLRRDSSALQLIQLIRDEAHRFALKYHRQRRALEFLAP